MVPIMRKMNLINVHFLTYLVINMTKQNSIGLVK